MAKKKASFLDRDGLINKNTDAHIYEFVACIHQPKDGCSCRIP
ncbi:hypothetical protein [Bacillus sp. TE8-1]|nr:hypothetical protein [Bacillus sp. TE8-1]